MKHIKYILIALTFVFNAISCRKSFLDVEDNAVILREQYVTDISTLQQYLTGIYISMGKDYYSAVTNPVIYADLLADNIKPSAINTSILIPHYTWNQSTGSSGSDTHMDGLWKLSYQLIRDCSFVIEKAQELIKDDAAKANQMRAEAYGLRALFHFSLVNIFAQSYNFSVDGIHPGVPYVTNWDWNDPVSRNTVKEVYDGMIFDLNMAIPLFTSNVNSKIIMNQLAAKALLARIYLLKEEWKQAQTLAQEVATAVPLLEAASYPAKLFTPEETEAIFQLAPSSSNLIAGGYNTGFPGIFFIDPNCYFLATNDIADLLTQSPSDSRIHWISSSASGEDTVRKYPINVIPGFDIGFESASHFQTLIRSSEMVLTVAEAAANTGDEITARLYLDAIRQRANPSAPNSIATGIELLDSIYLERRKELAFEGFRMWDVLRWKKGVNRNDASIGAPLTLPYPSDRAIAPIPQNDVNYGMSQNASY